MLEEKSKLSGITVLTIQLQTFSVAQTQFRGSAAVIPIAFVMWSLVKRENAGSLAMHDQISPEGHWLNKTGHVDFDSFLGGEGCHPQVYSPRGDEKQKVCIS